MRILVVEDHIDIAQLLCTLLTADNWIADRCHKLADAIELSRNYDYDAIILDLGLPDGSGMELLHHIRSELTSEKQPVIIMLTARDGIDDKIEAFENGAIDYVVKPYEPKELLTRLKVAMRFKSRPLDQNIILGNCHYDPTNRQLKISGNTVQLRRRELAIFDKLIRRKSNIVPYEELNSAVFAMDEEIESNALASHVSRLRKRIQDMGADININTMRHIGYYIEEKK